MEKETSRIHRLALPLIIEGRGSSLYVSDGMFGHEFELKDFRRLKVLSVDPEGFVTFEIIIPHQQEHIEYTSPIHGRFADVGFVIIGSSTAKSSSGRSRGTYDYYKRAMDETYYTVHKLGTKTKRIHLGSLQDPSSHIRQTARAIIQRFDQPTETWFDRQDLIPQLTPSLTHGQKLKSILDIFVTEGFLERRESHKRGKIHEEYKVTSKLHTLK